MHVSVTPDLQGWWYHLEEDHKASVLTRRVVLFAPLYHSWQKIAT